MQRLVMVPVELDAKLVKVAAKRSKIEGRNVTVQELLLEAAAAAHGVAITIRGRGRPGKPS